MNKKLIISSESIKDSIHTIQGVQVLLDRDLAKLYDFETRALKQAVNRNLKRFPSDFMFVLTEKEVNMMVSQNVIPSKKYLVGLQCPKYLWIVFNDKSQIPSASVADEFKFKQGLEVGELATKLFPSGIDLEGLRDNGGILGLKLYKD